jgi:hypothetical protein
MCSTLVSTADPTFLATLESWFRSHPEILVLIQYSHAAGSKDFEFFTSFQSLAGRIRELRPLTSVIAFRQPQLPLRGVVDDEFISRSLSTIPDGSEYLVVEKDRRVYSYGSWFHHYADDSHADLRDHLEECRGAPVAAGHYPPWTEDNEDVISAVVPDEHGVVRWGSY